MSKKWSKRRAKTELTKQNKVEVPLTITFSLDLSKLKELVERNDYYFAYDKKVGKRVVHILRDKYLISLVTGTKQRFKKW